jgi:pilus assembly protein Flp/PilA
MDMGNKYPETRSGIGGYVGTDPAHPVEQGEHKMSTMFMQAFLTFRSLHSTMLERARTERGASMVEYALLVGLIAVVAVVAVAALGGTISGLFSSANTCASGLTTSACSAG